MDRIMKLNRFYWLIVIGQLSGWLIQSLAWSATGIGYSDPFTIDRRVKPVIDSLQPTAGSTKGGITVTVKGDKFYSGLTSVKLDNQTVPAVSIQSESELSFELPAGNAGLVDLEILNPNGVSSQLSQAFKYEAPLVETVRVTLAQDSLVANGQATTQVTVKLLDQHGSVVVDETVNLLADRGQVSQQAKNNQDGTYTATYTVSQTIGTATITAVTSTGGKVGTASLELEPRQVSAAKSVVGQTSKWALIGPTGAKLQVKVLDQQGLPLSGLLQAAVHQVFQHFLAPALQHGGINTQSMGIQRIEVGGPRLDFRSYPTVEGRIAGPHEFFEASILDNPGRYLEPACKGIHAPHMGVEEILREVRFPAPLGIKVQPPRGETLPPIHLEDPQHDVGAEIDIGWELIRVPPDQLVPTVGIDRSECPRGGRHIQLMLHRVPRQLRMVGFNIELQVIQQVILPQEIEAGCSVRIVLVSGRLSGLGLDVEGALEPDGLLVFNCHVEEPCKVVPFTLHVGIQQC